MKKFFYYTLLATVTCGFKASASESLPYLEEQQTNFISHLFIDHKSAHLRHKGTKIIKKINQLDRNLIGDKKTEENFLKISKPIESLKNIQKKLDKINILGLSTKEANKRESFFSALKIVLHKHSNVAAKSQEISVSVAEDVTPHPVAQDDWAIDTPTYEEIPLNDSAIEVDEIPLNDAIDVKDQVQSQSQSSMPSPIDLSTFSASRKIVHEPAQLILNLDQDLLPNKPSFFAKHLKHRIVRCTAVTVVSYIKVLYHCYKDNPQSKKIILLKTAFKEMARSKFFKGSLALSLIFPKMPFE